MIGSGNQSLTPAQAQQIALARLIIADPHTLVLDEATSLIDPRTARTLEGSMNALLDGRTVVAIAHRLHTAHDADRIAVVIDGEIVELGSHHELVAQRRRVRRPLARLDQLTPSNAESSYDDSAFLACPFAPTRRPMSRLLLVLRRLGVRDGPGRPARWWR